MAIARALAKNPKILLCDEPTGALDYKTGKSVLALLQDTCRKTGRTVIVITHNTALTGMADRIVQVRSGQIISNEVNEHPVPVEEIEVVSQREKDLSQKHVAGTFRQQKAALPRYSGSSCWGS